MKRTLLASAVAALALALFFRTPLQRFLSWAPWWSWQRAEFICKPAHYTTEIISVDPLLIYISGFVSPAEIKSLISLGAPNLQKSLLSFPDGTKRASSDRTSSSAALPTSPQLSCILARAQAFMGATFPPGGDFGIAQLVRYEIGERFDLHRDWYAEPQYRNGRWHNRVASFFVYLESQGVRGGETWFPHVEVEERREEKWRKHEDGGAAFAPREGNALFWVNLHGNGTGDERVTHAGLPLLEGRKTAINIWPRKFYRR